MTRERADQGLLDTNALIHLASTDPDSLPLEPIISTLTLAELSVGPLVTDDPAVRAVRQAHLQQAESDFSPIPFDEKAARAFGRVSADIRSAGRKPAARAIDALLAATAIATGLPLYTDNDDDFAAITGLEVRKIIRARPTDQLL